MLTKLLHQDPFSGAGMDQGPTTPWYNTLYTNDPTQAGYRPDLDMENAWEQPIVGNLFKYGYLDVSGESPAVISAGVALTLSDPGTDTVSAALVDAVTSQCYGISLVSGGLVAGAEVGNWLYMENLGVLKPIKANTATTLIFSLRDTLPNGYDADVLAAGPAGSSNISIIRPGHVVANITPPGVTVGVTVNDIAEDQFISYQVRGLAMFIGNNSGDALVAGNPASVTTNGIIVGTDPTGVLEMQDCLIVPLISYDGANIRVPCYFKAAGI